MEGPTIIKRGAPFVNSDGKIEIPLEIEAMCLEGEAPGIGKVRVQAGQNYGLPPSYGKIEQMTPGLDLFPAKSSFAVIPKVEIAGMGSFCTDAMIHLEADPSISDVPPYGIPYVPPGGTSAEITFTDCCTGATMVVVIHVSHELVAPDPPVPQITITTSTITVTEDAGDDGVVGLDLISIPGDCSSPFLSSGDVSVSSGQSPEETANDLALALQADLALHPQCDIDISVVDNEITIVSRLLGETACCLTGTDLVGGVLLENEVNLGQEFNKSEVEETIFDMRCAGSTSIPSLSQWGLILLTLLLLTMTSVAIVQRSRNIQFVNLGTEVTRPNTRKFDVNLYKKVFIGSLFFIPFILGGFYLIFGELLLADLFGTISSLAIVSYLIHFLLLNKIHPEN